MIPIISILCLHMFVSHVIIPLTTNRTSLNVSDQSHLESCRACDESRHGQHIEIELRKQESSQRMMKKRNEIARRTKKRRIDVLYLLIHVCRRKKGPSSQRTWELNTDRDPL
eukprot:g61467.t1